MRKVTGYIGALIIVMALMGSILAGYALNVNGDTAVVSQYENVTDVSGLFTHAEEKTYIDYNPASNYIGYSLDHTEYTNTNLDDPYKKITNGTITVRYSDKHTIVNGTDIGYKGWPFICDYFVISVGGMSIYNGWPGMPSTATTDIEITISNGTTTVTYNGYTKTENTIINLVGSTSNDYDYCSATGRIYGNTDPVNAYYNDADQIISYGSGSFWHIATGNTVRATSGTPQTLTVPIIDTSSEYASGVYYENINALTTYNGNTYSPYLVFYPKSVYDNAVELGIDYTESTRVNNYPIEYEYHDNTEIQTLPQIDLKSISATNYWPHGTRWTVGSITINQNYTYNGDNYTALTINDLYVPRTSLPDPICKYSLYDVVSIMDIPVGTTQIIFDTGTGSTGIWVSDAGNMFNPSGHTVPSNFVTFTTSTSNTVVPMLDLNYGWKAYYTINTGLVDIYTSTGVKLYTASLNDTYVEFIKTANITGFSSGHSYGTDTNNQTVDFGVGATWEKIGGGNNDNNPYLNVTAITHGIIDNTKYIDPTKGISIKSSNTTNVTWNNEYENGDVKLLFRAPFSDDTYSNELTVSGNTIDVSYTNSRFNVTLNGGEPVDIGTWRNIILDVDLKNGSLNAIPVRAFNSFTNVQMDKSQIHIGDLINATPTNNIYWMPTVNSLDFNVYSTDVFMNTYGVVMADPTLTITDYFTNLDNFYRLELSDFSIYGDSITVNGQTGNVTSNRVSFGDESVIIKKMYITYENGHVYLEDSNATIDLGELTDNNISFSGAWYFKTFLEKGHTVTKQIYTWDWQAFIFDNTQFCIIYMGLAFIGLIIARRFCVMSMIDYAVFIASIIIALGVQVIA